MKKGILVISVIVVMIGLSIYFGIYYITPPYFVKSDIQKFLNEHYDGKFEVVEIDIEYSPDFFHQPTGYSLVLSDSRGIFFDNVYIQHNSVQGNWITYMGSDIETQYLGVKNNIDKDHIEESFDPTKTEKIK